LAEEEAREAQAPSEGERRTGFRSGAKSVFAKAGAAALGPSSAVRSRGSSNALSGERDVVDGDAATGELVRETPSGLPRTAPLPRSALGRRASLARLAATEPLVGVGPFPSPLPPQASASSSPIAAPLRLASTSPLPPPLQSPSLLPSPASSAGRSRDPM